METMKMQQKANEEWTLLDDKCFRHFHKLLKVKTNRATIYEIVNESGEKQSGQKRVARAFEQFYFDTVGTDNVTRLT